MNKLIDQAIFVPSFVSGPARQVNVYFEVLQSFEPLSGHLNSFDTKIRVGIVVNSFENSDVLDLTARRFEAAGKADQFV